MFGFFVDEREEDDAMGSSSILVYERLLLLASLDTDSDNTEKVFLSVDSLKSNKTVK